MRIGTVTELRLAARILRTAECHDPDLTVQFHEMARKIESVAPSLHDGVPIDTRLDQLAQDLESVDPLRFSSNTIAFD